MGKVNISKKGKKFIKEGNLSDLLKAIRNNGGSGNFSSNGKEYKYNIIGYNG